jgi:hypothetical protein
MGQILEIYFLSLQSFFFNEIEFLSELMFEVLYWIKKDREIVYYHWFNGLFPLVKSYENFYFISFSLSVF